jgi:polysaccharide export outer membrane protein
MNHQANCKSPPGWKVSALTGVSLLLLGPILTGCEHRISLAEFQTIQDQIHQEQQSQLEADMAAAKEQIDNSLGPFKAGPGDVLSVTVTPAGQPPQLPVQARIASDGTVHLPMVGKVQIGGMTLEQAEAVIHETYVPDYHVQAVVHVEVSEAATTNVMVVGAVGLPGLVSLRRTERNLLYATARAGGASQTASGLVTLKRLRRPEEQTTLNLRDPKDLKTALGLDPLADGDIVTVHAAKSNTIFVGGLVNAVGPQTYPPGTHATVLQAIAAAGGLRTDLIPIEGTLIRRVDGKDVHVKLHLDRLTKGEDENIELAAGDILWVPHTIGTRLHEIFNNTVYVRAGAVYQASYTDVGSNLRGDEKDREGTSTTIIGSP